MKTNIKKAINVCCTFFSTESTPRPNAEFRLESTPGSIISVSWTDSLAALGIPRTLCTVSFYYRGPVLGGTVSHLLKELNMKPCETEQSRQKEPTLKGGTTDDQMSTPPPTQLPSLSSIRSFTL